MSKINLLIKSCLRNEKKEYNIKGILNNQKIKYQDKNIIMVIDLAKQTMERIKENEKYFFEFKKNICIYCNKTLQVVIPINLVKCITQNNYFYVKYQIEDEIYELEIKQI